MIYASDFLKWLLVFNVPYGTNGGGGGGSTSVYATSTSALASWTYNNGASGVGATLTAPSNGTFTFDSVLPPVGSDVLYKNDIAGSGAYNGIYKVTTNDAGHPGVLTRAVDYNTPTKINSTGLIIANNGATLDGVAYYLSNYVTTIGTDPLTYALFTLGVSSITGTANQIIASSATGNVILSLPQSISTNSTPTFLKVIAQNFLAGYQVVTTSSGLTSLDTDSPYVTRFIGSSNQDLELPPVDTLQLGQTYKVINDSDGSIHGLSFDGFPVQLMAANTEAFFTCINIVSDSEDAWTVAYSYQAGGSVTSVALSVPGSSIFGVTGSPITAAGTLGLTTTGTQYGIPYFSLTSRLSSTDAGLINQSFTSNELSAPNWSYPPVADFAGVGYGVGMTDGTSVDDNNLGIFSVYNAVNAIPGTVAPDNSTITFSSSNAAIWSSTSLDGSSIISGFAYGKGIYVVALSASGFWYSVDGINWTQSSITAGAGVLTFMGNAFFCTTGTDIYRSIDGINWSVVIAGRQAGSFGYYYGAYLCGTDNGPYYSYDGITWVASATTAAGSFFEMCFGKNIWIGATSSTDGGLWWSVDNGKTWTVGFSTTRFGSVIYANNTFLAGTRITNTGVYYSDDGKSWAQATGATTLGFNAFAYGKNIWVGATASDGVYYSTNNGRTWSASFLTGIAVNDIVYKNNLFVAAGAGSSRVYYSTDGINWTGATGLSNNGFFLLWTNGLWLCGTGGGKVYYSKSGIIQASALPITASTTNATFYPGFYSATSGNLAPNVSTGFTFNPSTNTLGATNLNLSGNFTSSGASKFFLADFTTTAGSGRFMFQTTTADSSTFLTIVPSGAGTGAIISLFGASNAINTASLQTRLLSTSASINSTHVGSGTTQPLSLQMDGVAALTIAPTTRLINIPDLTASKAMFTDASKNVVSVTFGSGTANQLAYYASSGFGVSGLTSNNLSVFTTSVLGVPSSTPTIQSVNSPADNVSLYQSYYLLNSAIATGTAPRYPIYYQIAGVNYLSVANSTAGTFSTYSFNGTVWSSIGAAVACGNGPRLLTFYTIGGTNYLSVANLTDSTFSTFSWSGSAWVSIGAAVAGPTGCFGILYASLSSTDYLIVVGNTSHTVQMFSWTGSAWTPYGSPVNVAAGPIGLNLYTFSGTTYLSTINSTATASISTLSWNGTALVSAGADVPTGGTISDFGTIFTSNSINYYAVTNNTSNNITLFQWVSTAWVSLGLISAPASPVGITSFTIGSNIYVTVSGSSSTTGLITYIWNGTTLTPISGAYSINMQAFGVTAFTINSIQYLASASFGSNLLSVLSFSPSLSVYGFPTTATTSNASFSLLFAASTVNKIQQAFLSTAFLFNPSTNILTTTGLNLTGLTASQAVVTDSSKNMASLAYTSANTSSTLVARDGSGNASLGIIGLTTGSTPTAGLVGETLLGNVDSGSAVSLTTTVVTVITSIAYTAGNWTISANPTFIGTGITATEMQVFIGTASGTSLTGQLTKNTAYAAPFAIGITANSTAGIPSYSFSANSSGTLYLKAKATFTVGTCTAYGSMTMMRSS